MECLPKYLHRTLTATIGKKASKTFDVVANITPDKLANGYEVKKVSLDETKVGGDLK